MGLSNISFIAVFILIFVPLYYVLPAKFKRYLLLTGSIIFYALNDIYVLPILIINFILAYFIGKGIDKYQYKPNTGKAIMTLGILLQIAVMVTSIIYSRMFFYAFIGIGFITVQIIGYYHDIYDGEFYACDNLLNFLNYMLFFPKILQGPIVGYKDLKDDFETPKNFNVDRLEKGIRIFILGMTMKVLLADRLYFLWNGVQTIGFLSISTELAWLTMFSYSMQLYLDFQGYSLMAIGIAMILGFDLPSNFKSPYLSRSISEFYRKWHITLGQWFKNHIYIPLGGSRNGTAKMIISTFVVWLLTGLWHGLTINFLIWADILFICILLEKTVFKKIVDSENIFANIFGHLYVLFVIPISWMVFAITDLEQLLIFFSRLFNITSLYVPVSVVNGDAFTYLTDYMPYLIGGIICCLPVMENILVKTRLFITRIICFFLFWLCIYVIMKNGNNPFMYINF